MWLSCTVLFAATEPNSIIRIDFRLFLRCSQEAGLARFRCVTEPQQASLPEAHHICERADTFFGPKRATNSLLL
jgi:hypothetical protein